jgi:1-acyl-sn-glycerol-3-phosphate acyltransferase
MRSPHRRWRFAHRAIRTFARGAGIRIEVEGDLAWPLYGSVVVVANHGSFLDGIALVGSFPEPISPVAASEFARRPFVGSVLKRVGSEFVHRGDPVQVSRDTRHLLQRLRNQGRLLIFPEGSLDERSGLRPFEVGAFFLAAQTGSPVVPLGVVGSGTVLRPGRYLPSRGTIEVKVGEPVLPIGTRRRDLDWLSECVRDQLLALSGLADLESGRPEDPGESQN